MATPLSKGLSSRNAIRRTELGGRFLAALALVAMLGACATAPPYDYTAFKQNRPASMLVLPPLNETPEVLATYGVLSHVTLPLAEAGYYVIPVTLMDETFRQNGLNSPAEIHDVSPQKLREIFGADAAVYIKITQYGTSYAVVASDTRVSVEARIVDLRSGDLLWQGKATASSSESRNNQNQGGLLGLLVTAIVQQIVETAADAGIVYAGVASQRLLSPRPNGLLYGPRSPNYKTD
jgi:hypothetical protein